MNLEIFCGTIKECNYTGYAGNTLGKLHNSVIYENVYLVKVCNNGYARLDELLDDDIKPQVLKRYLPSIGEYFVDDLILVDEIVPILKSIVSVNSKERIK